MGGYSKVQGAALQCTRYYKVQLKVTKGTTGGYYKVQLEGALLKHWLHSTDATPLTGALSVMANNQVKIIPTDLENSLMHRRTRPVHSVLS